MICFLVNFTPQKLRWTYAAKYSEWKRDSLDPEPIQYFLRIVYVKKKLDYINLTIQLYNENF